MFYPLTFRPIFKERIWGGRNLERLYRKPLPPAVPIGESWEITDRPEGVSEITHGPLAGRDLRWLMENHAAELLGRTDPIAAGRFPLLVKILDAQDVLSLQVHPPAALAASLGGEPKTEVWYFAETTPTAEIFVGLKRGVTREEFERRLGDGSVAQCFHRHAVKAGDAMFLPSGRVHALGAGSVIFEIQQNSDTIGTAATRKGTCVTSTLRRASRRSTSPTSSRRYFRIASRPIPPRRPTRSSAIRCSRSRSAASQRAGASTTRTPAW